MLKRFVKFFLKISHKLLKKLFNLEFSSSIQTTFLSAPIPENEKERLEALHRYHILNTAAEAAFDDITNLAAYICGTPISLISLTADRCQWFKSKVGLEVSEVSRDIAFCAHAILDPEQVFVVPDTRQDVRFANNPLVLNDPQIRFYAGTPLVTADGFPLGALCAMDREPRQLTQSQLKALQALGRQVVTQMELRANLGRLQQQMLRYQQTEAKLRANDRQVVDFLESITDGFFALDRQWAFSYINEKAGQFFQQPIDQLLSRVFWEVLPQLKESNLATRLRRATSQKIGLTFEEFHPSFQLWYEVRIFPSEEGISVFLADITQRKLIEFALKDEQERSEQLLLNILPKEVATKLKEKPDAIAESFDNVAILFSDLVKFTELGSRVPPQVLVQTLNEIFSIFDCLTEKYNLEKIKTIGDAYMVVGGLPKPHPDSAQAMADMALEMLAEIDEFNIIHGTDLTLRIGINMGSVVAGVIGQKKFSYDLWGDAVNLASRMESQSLNGQIQVSETIYLKLRDRYQFEARGTLAIKGQGEMKTYLLLGK